MDTIEVTEQQRQKLEQSVEKLRKALQHWRIQSAEYEGLHEELLALPSKAGRKDVLALADDFGGDVITTAEITSFLGDKEGIKRTPKQVAEAVRHRINYVQGNVDKLEQQLELGETTLDNLRVIQNDGMITNEEGLPVMDIKEELDDKGNVIKSEIESHKNGAAKAMDLTAAMNAFKPFVEDLAEKEKDAETTKRTVKSDTVLPSNVPSMKEVKASTPIKTTTLSKEQMQMKPSSSPKPQQPRTPKRIQATAKEYSPQTGMILVEKRIKPKLVPDVKEEMLHDLKKEEEPSIKDIIAPPEPKISIVKDEVPKDASKKEGIAAIKVIEDDDSDASEDPFDSIPEVEEEEEDSQLRQEMIRYNLREMNNIVAELELENGSDDYDDEDDEDLLLGSDEEEVEDDDDEDQWGRTTGQLVSNKLRREMEKLQKKVDAREMAKTVATEVGNVSELTEPVIPVPSEVRPSPSPPPPKGILTEKRKDPAEKKAKLPEKKKGVRFADDLDISPAPPQPQPTASQLVADGFEDEDIDPSILDMIFGPGTKDREDALYHPAAEEPTRKKLPSLFKAAREVQKAKEQIAVDKAASAKRMPVRTNAPATSDIVERSPNAIAPEPKAPANSAGKKMTKTSAKTSQPVSQPVVVSLDPRGEELSDDDRPIMSSSVIERAPTWKANTSKSKPSPSSESSTSSNTVANQPNPPDELDPDLHRREVTNAYFGVRNRLIQKQGGFVESEEEKMHVPLDENGEKRKVSRFKASRVKGEV